VRTVTIAVSAENPLTGRQSELIRATTLVAHMF